MIGISENSQRSYVIGPKGRFIFEKISDTSQQDISSGYAQPSRKYSIEILAKIERKKNRILAPPGFDSGQTNSKLHMCTFKSCFFIFPSATFLTTESNQSMV